MSRIKTVHKVPTSPEIGSSTWEIRSVRSSRQRNYCICTPCFI